MGFSLDSAYNNPYFNNLKTAVGAGGGNAFYSDPFHGVDVNSLYNPAAQDNSVLLNLIQQNANGAFAPDALRQQDSFSSQRNNFLLGGTDTDTSLSATIQNMNQSRIVLSDGVTEINNTSELLRLKFDETGTPDVSNLSTREIKILLNDQYGLRDVFAQLPEEQKAQLLATAKEKNMKDPTGLLLEPLQAEILNSPLYDEVKSRTQGMRPKEIYQLAADTTLSVPEKIALQMIGDAKSTVYKNRKKNFDDYIQRMGQEDPGAAEARQKAEELEKQVAKNAAGGGGEDGGSSANEQPAPWGAI